MNIETMNEHRARGIEYARRAHFRRLALFDIEHERFMLDIREWAAENAIELGVSDLESPDDIERVARRAADLARVMELPAEPFAPRPFILDDYVAMFADRRRVIPDDWAAFIPDVAPLARSEWAPITDAALSGAMLSYESRLERAKVAAAPMARKRSPEARTARFAALLAERAVIKASRVTLDARAPIERIEWARTPSLLRAWRNHVDTLARPDSDVQLATTFDPMGIHPWSLAIQRAGSELLTGHGFSPSLPDVYVPRRGRFVCAPDHVAFKGTARYVLPQPCRYGRVGKADAAETRIEWALADDLRHTVSLDHVDDSTPVRLVTTTELLTMPKWTHAGDNTGSVRMAWRGHRKITLSMATRSGPVPIERKAVSAARKARGAAVKGPNVNAWDRSPEKLARTITTRQLTDVVARIESIIRTSSEEHALIMSDGTTITLRDSSSMVTHDGTGRTFPVREFARRAALAGIDIE